MISDKLLINLKILSKIQKNGRISRSLDGIISLEIDTFYQSFRRFLTSDSRRQAISEINSIISECIDTLNHITNSKWMNKEFTKTEEFKKSCEFLNLLLSEIKSAKIGIDNLKFTYQSDPNISCQLDIINLKINSTIKDFTQKLINFNGMNLDDDFIEAHLTTSDLEDSDSNIFNFNNGFYNTPPGVISDAYLESSNLNDPSNLV